MPTGRRLVHEAQLRNADARPHPTVMVARPGSGRSGAGDELGGGRNSGASGDGAVVRKRARRGATEALRDAGSALGACPGPNGHQSITGDECGRRRVRLDVVRQLRRAREGAERGSSSRSSRRLRRGERRARGSIGASGAARRISGGRGGEKHRGGASGPFRSRGSVRR